MAKYIDRKTEFVKADDIDVIDLTILNRLLKTKKLTEAQKVALQRLISAWHSLW